MLLVAAFNGTLPVISLVDVRLPLTDRIATPFPEIDLATKLLGENNGSQFDSSCQKNTPAF
ncbi:MAG: hypothetical protein KGQ48_00575 [Bradyrhizobium sp.]|nr:hypothetical protein [Bradyrhizobium sp.]